MGEISSLNAKAWGLIEGLKWTWSRGFKKVMIEYNCKQLVNMILSAKKDAKIDLHILNAISMGRQRLEGNLQPYFL